MSVVENELMAIVRSSMPRTSVTPSSKRTVEEEATSVSMRPTMAGGIE